MRIPPKIPAAFPRRPMPAPAHRPRQFAAMDRWKVLELSNNRQVGVLLLTPVNSDPLADLKRIGHFDAVLPSSGSNTIGHQPFLTMTEAILKGEDFFRLAPYFHCLERYSLKLPQVPTRLGANRKSFFSIDMQLGSSTVSRIEVAEGTGERVVDMAFIFSLFPTITAKPDRFDRLQSLPFSMEHLMGLNKPKKPWWQMGFGKDPSLEIFPLPFFVEHVGQTPQLGLQVNEWRNEHVDLTCVVHQGDVRYLNFFQPQFADPYQVQFEVDWPGSTVVTTLQRFGRVLTLRFPLQKRPNLMQSIPLLHPTRHVVYGNALLLTFVREAELFLEWGNHVTFYGKFSSKGDLLFHRAEDGRFESMGSQIFPNSKVGPALREAFVAMRASVVPGTPTDLILKGIWHAFEIS